MLRPFVIALLIAASSCTGFAVSDAIAANAGTRAVQADQRVVLDLYFVRHAETKANATGVYTSKLTNLFSRRGEQMVAELTAKLRKLHFDRICVSPMKRAENTIYPYLKLSHSTAQVWPELAECCNQKARGAAKSAELPRGSEITVPADVAEYIRVPARDNRWVEPANYADGMTQVSLLVSRIRREFGFSHKKVLLVGHSLAGSRMIEMLLGMEPNGRTNIQNAAITHLQQLEDGSFRLVELNGQPVK
jgi:broad specificity phosphatase PhoE